MRRKGGPASALSSTDTARSIHDELRQRLRTRHRMLHAERREIAIAAERGFQQLVILPPRHFERAEGFQVVGHELRVEQLETAGPEARDEMHQRDLRGVARAVEHALAEESAAERDAVETADERVAVIDLDAVAMAAVVELAIEHADARVDPGARTPGLRFRAAVEHGVE